MNKKRLQATTLFLVIALVAYTFIGYFLTDNPDEVKAETSEIVRVKASNVLPGKDITKPRETSAFSLAKEGASSLARMQILSASEKYFAADEEKELQSVINANKARLIEFYVMEFEPSLHFALLKKTPNGWAIFAFTPDVFLRLEREKLKKEKETAATDAPLPNSTTTTTEQNRQTTTTTQVTAPPTTIPETTPPPSAVPEIPSTPTTLKDEGTVETVK